MKVKSKLIKITTGGIKVVVLPPKIAKQLDLHPLDRVRIKNSHGSVVAVVDFWSEPEELVGLFKDTFELLKIKDGDEVELIPVKKPESVTYIVEKMDGKELDYKKLKSIISDLMNGDLTEIEMTAFVSAVYMRGATLIESLSLTKAIAESGDILKFNGIVADKHCTGGVPGNRTTMIIVPIISSLGIKMVKTSSRAITSPSGTADVMEVLAKVDLTSKEISQIAKKVGACIAWGGGTNIASADDKLIEIRNPLRLDPEGLLLASIMAKKYATGATHLVIDIPVGEETKIKSVGEGKYLENRFKSLSELLGIKCDVVLTNGNEPIGNGIGPFLEAIDVLKVLKQDKNRPIDLEDKSLLLAGLLLELTGFSKRGEGQERARKQLVNGAAWKQMQKIIKAQSGNPNIEIKDLKPAEHSYQIKSPKRGVLINTNNFSLAKLARVAGAPETKEAGVYLHVKYGEVIKKDQTLATVYSNSPQKLTMCKELFKPKDIFMIE